MMRSLTLEGLSPAEVTSQRARFGSNGLPPPETATFIEKLLENLKEPLVKVLLAALAVTLILASLGYASWTEGIGIAVAVVLATVVSTYSEHKNEQSFQKLQQEASKIVVTVFRGNPGVLTAVAIEDLVVGDYVLLEPGTLVPADGEITHGQLLINQQSLTGEAHAVNKVPRDAPSLRIYSGDALSEVLTGDLDVDFNAEHLLYRGSVVEDGEGVFLIRAVGGHSVYGKLAQELAQDDDRQSPLQYKLSVRVVTLIICLLTTQLLAEAIAKLAYVGAVCVAISFLFKQLILDQGGDFASAFVYARTKPLAFIQDLVSALTLAVIVIVVAVPEGLPMMIAIVLSLNMRRLLKANVLVRRLLGIEAAGSISLLLCDKTGTLTRGRFEPKVFVTGEGGRYSSPDEMPPSLRTALLLALQEGTPSTRHPLTGQILGGNASDQALLAFVRSYPSLVANKDHIRTVHSLLFNSTRKFSAIQLALHADLVKQHQSLASVSAQNPGGDWRLTIVKGAPEVIHKHCVACLGGSGLPIEFSMNLRRHLESEIHTLSSAGLRVIAVAATSTVLEDSLPSPLVLLGFMAVGDEVRTGAAKSIERCSNAGIQTIMITGDKKETAMAVADELGMLREVDFEKAVLTSEELRQIDDVHVGLLLPSLRVIARAVPTDKSRLVRIGQSVGHVVAMTGDGVNDSAALKASDVGFAMGSGSEVAKEAADIVILDDNVSSIAQAVLYGRTIFRSIRKFIVFQSTVNLASFLVVFLGPFLGFDFPLSLIQLLWWRVHADHDLALAYGGEPALSWYMNTKPVDRSAPIISFYMWSSILLNGGLICLLSLLFLVNDSIETYFSSHEALLTGYFCFFIFATNMNSLNVRTRSSNLLQNIGENRNFVMVISFIFLVQITFTYIGGEWLHTVPLNLNEWMLVTFLAALVIPFDLLRKLYLLSWLKKYLPLRLRRFMGQKNPTVIHEAVTLRTDLL